MEGIAEVAKVWDNELVWKEGKTVYFRGKEDLK